MNQDDFDDFIKDYKRSKDSLLVERILRETFHDRIDEVNLFMYEDIHQGGNLTSYMIDLSSGKRTRSYNKIKSVLMNEFESFNQV